MLDDGSVCVCGVGVGDAGPFAFPALFIIPTSSSTFRLFAFFEGLVELILIGDAEEGLFEGSVVVVVVGDDDDDDDDDDDGTLLT